MSDFFRESWVWVVTTLAAFGLCTYLPILIKNDRLRQKVYWVILVPVSLVIIFYCYPVGMEVFTRWGNRF